MNTLLLNCHKLMQHCLTWLVNLYNTIKNVLFPPAPPSPPAVQATLAVIPVQTPIVG